MIHGAFAGLATVLFATQLQVIQSTVPPNLELTIITAAVIGGVSILGGSGTVIGSTLAAILFATIGSALIFINVSAYWLRAVIGALILATVHGAAPAADMIIRPAALRNREESRASSQGGGGPGRWRSPSPLRGGAGGESSSGTRLKSSDTKPSWRSCWSSC
jgi:hypothetical protein